MTFTTPKNLLCGSALLACFASAIVPLSANTPLPNVVMIMADDLGWSDIAAYRRQQGLSDPIPTPHLDRLCTEGMMFTDAHSAAALCAPTRFSMMTGSNPYRNGRQWGTWQHTQTSAFSSNRNHVTVGEIAQAAGYRTAFFGKMHFGGGSTNFETPMPEFPTSYGFDYVFSTQGGIQNAPYLYFENDRFVKIDPADPLNPSVPGTNADLVQWAAGDYPIANGTGNIQVGQIGTGDANWNSSQNGIINSKKAVAFIDDHLANHGSQPFLLYYNAPQVHVPHTPPVDFNPNADGTPHASSDPDFVQVQGITGGTHVADVTHELDLQVGRIIDKLEDPNGDGNTSDSLLPNTLFMFTSDNGGLVTDRGITGYDSTGVLRSSKANPWEGGHRVPFIAMWPGKIAANTVSDQLIASHDWVAMVYSLTGTAIPSDQAMDCVNILPVLRGEQPESVPIRNFLMTQGHEGDPNPDKPLYVMRQGQYALLMDRDRNPAEFYDLSTDLRQQNNLIADPSQQERIAAMEALFKQYDEENDPPSSPALINSGPATVLIRDDFEADTLGSAPTDWTLNNGPTTFTVESAAQSPIGAPSDNRGLQLDNDPNVQFENITRTFDSQSGTFYLQFDYLGVDTSELHNLQIGDGDLTTPNRGINLTMSTTGGVTEGNWFRFTLTVDAAADTYDLRLQSLGNTSVDTTTLGLPFVNPQAELDILKFWFNTTSNGSGQFALDNVLLTTDFGELNFEVIQTVFIDDGFESDTLGSAPTGWTLNNGPTTFTVESAAQSPLGGIGDDRGMRLTNDAGTTFENMERGFSPQTGTFYVQFDYCGFGGMAQLHNLQIGDGDVTSANRGINLTMSTTSGVVVDKWYRFTLTIDVATDTYDMRVRSLEDSSLDTTTADLGFVNPQSQLSIMRFWFNTGSAGGTGDFAVDNILVTTDPNNLNFGVIVPTLSDFSIDPLTGASEVSIQGSVGINYKLVEADDLDFTNPDQDPVPLDGASVGTLNGNHVVTTAGGDATIQFNLGTAKSATFVRAEEAP